MNEPSSLYRCPECGDVIRDVPGRVLKHIHDETTSLYIEFQDDGREGVEDVRDAIWLA